MSRRCVPLPGGGFMCGSFPKAAATPAPSEADAQIVADLTLLLDEAWRDLGAQPEAES